VDEGRWVEGGGWRMADGGQQCHLLLLCKRARLQAQRTRGPETGIVSTQTTAGAGGVDCFLAVASREGVSWAMGGRRAGELCMGEGRMNGEG
jgi:hypothetical protein